MPDIFGREPEDYGTLQALSEALGDEGVRQHQEYQARRIGAPVHNFNALGAYRSQASLIEADEPNAQAIQYIASNLTAIQQMADEILYQETRFQDYVSINMNIPAGSKSYGVRVTDTVGQGQFIDVAGSNAPTAGASQRLVTYPLRYGGIIPEWTFHEIRNAMVAGFPLTMEVLQAGMDGAVNHIEQLVFKGDDLTGIKGLINHGDVTVEAATGGLAGLTGQQLVDELQKHVRKFIADSNEIIGRRLRGGFCIYVPTVQCGVITDKRLPDGNDLTAWQFFQRHNQWKEMTGEDIMLKSLLELKDAAANKTDDRMIIGLINNDRVLEYAVPLAPRIVHVIPQAFGIQAPIEYEVEPGITMKRPDAIKYIDGI